MTPRAFCWRMIRLIAFISPLMPFLHRCSRMADDIAHRASADMRQHGIKMPSPPIAASYRADIAEYQATPASIHGEHHLITEAITGHFSVSRVLNIIEMLLILQAYFFVTPDDRSKNSRHRTRSIKMITTGRLCYFSNNASSFL